ncbi:MAG: hypothetical protein LBE57_03815, partial [Methanosarcinales archaeon]|jgi:hypothetical protein|nr:hypothetical protein [Methanosarcinales archaeon]
MGKAIEPRFPDLKNCNKELESNVGFLLNWTHIRHNNLEGHKKLEILEQLSNEELENLYDCIYDVLLYSFLTLDYNSRLKQEIESLKPNRS